MTRRLLPVLLVMIGLCLSALAHARTIQDPMADFIATESTIEEGKYKDISRLQVDLNRDGKKIVFLANIYVRHAGMAWTVYVPGRHGYTRGTADLREREMLCFMPDHCYLGYIPEIKHRGLAFFVGRVVDGFVFNALWVEGGKVHIKDIGHTKPPETDTAPEDPLFQRYFPDLEATNRKPPFTMETLSMDDLRAKGYTIPKIDP